jgi:hypothetical protein
MHLLVSSASLVDTALACIDRRMPIERRVRHAMETARALSAWNRTEEALTTLLDAEKLAPEQVRHHAISRQLVQSWMRRGRGRPATNSPRSPVACPSLIDRDGEIAEYRFVAPSEIERLTIPRLARRLLTTLNLQADGRSSAYLEDGMAHEALREI